MSANDSVPLEDAAGGPHTTHRVGGWLPHNPQAIKNYIEMLMKKIEARGDVKLEPTVQAFQDLIEANPMVYAGANLMISQVPAKYETDPSGGPRLVDYKQMCRLINEAILSPPPYNDTELVAFPINAILDWSMGTPAGWSFYLMESVNKALADILNAWGEYLSSSASLIAFEKPPDGGGWMTSAARAKLRMYRFVKPKPKDLAWGYESWNQWFIRLFKQRERPISDPDDDKAVSCACESTPFSLQTDVQLRSTFWIKNQPYALRFMLNDEDWANYFVGGTVYQAFLSAFNYHRWHAPVNGKVLDHYVLPGSYYAESPAVGFDEGGPNLSQGYITNVAARAVMYIQADDPVIDKMCVVAIGMAEVSTCKVTVEKGQVVKKGDELGYFQFGGSTHCLIFRKGAIKSWSTEAIPGPTAGVKKVNSWLARVADEI